ncbi:MAG: hypothetical protein HXY30_18970 [Pseudorhodoplanes sp.]|nr:hypothetical protein [Pseudorhodoplanes sp.]
MAAIGSKSKYFRVLSARENLEAWRAKRKVMREDFEARQAEANAALSSAIINRIDAGGTRAANLALARIQAETKAKQEAAARKAAQEDNDPTRVDLKDSQFSTNSVGTLDSGTSINLNSGQITLSNGVTIDIKTGARVNYTA